MGWLGYFIGKNTCLKELNFDTHIQSKPFYMGLSHNTTIQKMYFEDLDLLDGEIFHLMSPFLKGDHNLTEFQVVDCEFGDGCARHFSLALGACNKSFKKITLSNMQMGDGQLSDIIVALSMHPQLEQIDLASMNIGRNECTALATLLQCTTTELQKLNLNHNRIDDKGLDDLIRSLVNGHQLQGLYLASNQLITTRGWESLSTLLEVPNSNLEELVFSSNNIGDNGALTFANALVGNSKLKNLYLHDNGITDEGWASFSQPLCDTTSINKTYASNHTLQSLIPYFAGFSHPEVVQPLLDLNGTSEDKKQIAMKKILRHHPNIDMKPFFEWDSKGERSLKALPYVMSWFDRAEKAVADDNGYNYNIGAKILSTVFQFAQAMPLMFVPASQKGSKVIGASQHGHKSIP